MKSQGGCVANGSLLHSLLAGPKRAGKRTVLVIDDDESFHRFLAHCLESLCCETLYAATGADGLRLAAQMQPDLILLDWVLKNESGERVLGSLKGQPATARIPVVMMSGILESEGDAELAKRLGAECFMVKQDLCNHTIDRIEQLLTPPQTRSSGKLLVVEDDPSFQDFLTTTLSARHYQAVAAATGRDGFYIARTFKPDLILLDLTLPDLNGVEVLQMLKADDRTCAIPVAAMTENGDSSSLIKSALMALGASEFLYKPFSDHDCLAVIGRLLGSRERMDSASARLSRGRIRVDPATRKAWFRGSSREVPGKRFDLLVLLFQHPEGLTREALATQGWTEPDTVKRTIQRLRNDLAVGGSDAIVTIPGGYRLVG